MHCRTWLRSSLIAATAAAAVAILTWGTARASFQLVEDFEGLLPGPIDGQNGWNAENLSSIVTTDPIGGDNQVLSVITESTHLYKALLLPDGVARMFFLRLRVTGQLSYSLGMSDVITPSRFDHFESELGMTNSSNELRINDGGTYEVLAELDVDTWYNCWIFIDNIHDQSQVWLHARGLLPATADDQLDSEGQTVFQFRDTVAGDLVNFFIKTGGGGGLPGPLFLDEMYLEDTDALDLDNPAAVSGAVGDLVAAPALMLAPASPNPFHGATTLRFAAPPANDARLFILDLEGRTIAQLATGNLAGPQQAAVWQGRDAWGRPVAAGVYFCRLEAGGQVLTRSVVLAK